MPEWSPFRFLITPRRALVDLVNMDLKVNNIFETFIFNRVEWRHVIYVTDDT